MATTEETPVEPIPTFAKPPAKKPKYFVAGDTFFAQTSDGEMKVQLRLKTRLVRAIRQVDEEIDQFFALLDGLGDADTVARLDELDIFETGAIAAAYFQAWQEKNEASLGEARRS